MEFENNNHSLPEDAGCRKKCEFHIDGKQSASAGNINYYDGR